MIEEKLREIKELINQEIEEYSILSNLYDIKKQCLIKSNIKDLQDNDIKIEEVLNKIKNIENKRKCIDEDLGVSNANISSYLEIANKNALSIEKEFTSQKNKIAEISISIAKKEKTNIELVKLGLGTVNKLINIIINGATKSSQYNNYGKNSQDECLNISSIVEEV